MQAAVCEIIVETLRGLDLKFPHPSPEVLAELPAIRERLLAENEPPA